MINSLQVQGLGKCYGVYANPQQRLKRLLTGAAVAKQHWSLRDVSFSLQKGQCLGVIGDNGAGKSTLLKLLAGSLQASQGTIQRSGRLTAILELGAGFHPEFTGRENLQFAGGFIGFSAQDMVRFTPEILSFCELGEAIDRPLKTYSSGMVVRLAFALVTAVQPEVLIIDEALAVGDQHFQKKCVERIEHFRNQGCTILFCSHSLYHVRQLCDQVLWLDQGRMKAWGPMDEVISAYETHVRLQDSQTQSTATKSATAHAALTDNVSDIDIHQQGSVVGGGQTLAALPNGRAAITQAWVQGLESTERPVQRTANMRITLQASTPGVDAPSMGFMLEQFKGVGIMSLATHAEGVKPVAIRQVAGHTEWSVSLTLTDLPLHSGTYALSFYLFDAQGLVVFDEWKNHIVFDWINPSLTPGLVRLPHVWA